MTILIVGAGPSGARLAELLADVGIEVTLIDRISNPHENIFSSAALPISSLIEDRIPRKAISSYFNSVNVFTCLDNKYNWRSKNKLGIVLDFGEFRSELWNIAIKKGVNILSGCSVHEIIPTQDYVNVKIINSENKVLDKRFLWVVDATGNSRSIIGKYQTFSKNNNYFVRGYGLEWIVEVDKKTYDVWINNLNFILGSKYIKHGYGWVFPMSKNRLKVGVCTLPPQLTMKNISLNECLANIFNYYNINILNIIDKHGGGLSSTLNMSEILYKDRIIAVGDAISSVSILGGEGIRHALRSADILAPLISDILQIKHNKKINSGRILARYNSHLRGHFDWRWRLSNKIGKHIWYLLDSSEGDKHIDRLLNELHSKTSAEELLSLLFDYKFERYGLKILPYLMGWREN